MTSNNKGTYLQSLGTLQLAAVIAVVLGHFWLDDSVYMNSVGVSFCFVYSGYFTAMRHKFGQGYATSWPSSTRFMCWAWRWVSWRECWHGVAL